MKQCTNCGGFDHPRSKCPMPKPDAVRRETSLDLTIEAALRPNQDQQRVHAGFLAGQHPDWSYSRCMHRALIEWQKRSALLFSESSPKRMRA